MDHVYQLSLLSVISLLESCLAIYHCANKLLRLLFKNKSKNVPVVTLYDHYDFILIPKQYVRKKNPEKLRTLRTLRF